MSNKVHSGHVQAMMRLNTQIEKIRELSAAVHSLDTHGFTEEHDEGSAVLRRLTKQETL